MCIHVYGLTNQSTIATAVEIKVQSVTKIKTDTGYNLRHFPSTCHCHNLLPQDEKYHLTISFSAFQEFPYEKAACTPSTFLYTNSSSVLYL